MRLSLHNLIALAVAVLAFHMVGVWLVADYYSDHIAHYDSVGGYISAFEAILLERKEGYGAAIKASFEAWPLSITQNLFQGFFSPILSLSPESIQLYNTIAIAIALFGISVLMSTARAPFVALIAGLALFFLPDALYWWDLGIFDYRRDAGMFGLLTATLFLGCAYFSTNLEPRARMIWGVVFGATAGLVLICRDSAPVMLAGCVLAPLGILWLYALITKSFGPQIDRALWPLIGFAPFALLFFARFEDILQRITNPLIMYGMDQSGGTTLQGNFRRLPDALVGQFSYPFNDLKPLGLIVVIAALAVLGPLAFRGVRNAANDNKKRAMFLIGCGVWIPAFVHVFLSVFARWSADQPPIVAMAPYLTAMVGAVAFFVGLLLLGLAETARGWSRIAVAALAALIFVSAPLRALARHIDYPDGNFAFHQSVAALRSRDGGAAVIAEMTQSTEALRVPALKFLALRSGGQAPERLYYGSPSFGLKLDFQLAPPTEEDKRAELLGAMDRAARCKADYIVVSADSAEYDLPNKALLLYGYGRPMIEALRNDLAAAPTRTIATGQTPVLLIDNRQRSACSTKQP